MSVEFLACTLCKKVVYEEFIDRCDCGTKVCFPCQVQFKMRTELQGYYNLRWHKSGKLAPYWEVGEDYSELVACPCCRKEVILDSEILQYLLQKYALNKEQVIEEIKQTSLGN